MMTDTEVKIQTEAEIRLTVINDEALLARSGGATVMRIDEVLDLVNGPIRLPRGSE